MPTDSPGLGVHPFRATTYAAHTPDDLARVSSPAYDLVTAAGRARLASADPHNVVRLILPAVPAGPGDAAERDRRSAAQAAASLRDWRATGVLVDDPDPTMWLYRMSGPGDEVTTGWLGAVDLPHPGSTAVLPHEDVYAPAVEGRRVLLAATRTDLEPVVLAHDPSPETAAIAATVAAGPADLDVQDDDGVRHQLWRVAEPGTLAGLTAGFASTEAVIADGHHRVAAARQHAGGGDGRVLALLTPMGPGGLRVQAIHRVVPGLGLESAVAAAAAGFTVTPLSADHPAELVPSWGAQPGTGALLLTDGRRTVELSDPTAEVRSRIPVDAPPSWRSLDVVLAHHGLLAGLWGVPDDPAAVRVAHDVPEALRLAAETAGVALLLRSPSPSDVAAVARAGARMPRKSTLFVPKPRTGLVFRPH